MYSIVVNVHYPLKRHSYCGYGICIGIKLNGIDESQRNIKLYKTQKEGREIFEQKIVAIYKATSGYKENEYERCLKYE